MHVRRKDGSYDKVEDSGSCLKLNRCQVSRRRCVASAIARTFSFWKRPAVCELVFSLSFGRYRGFRASQNLKHCPPLYLSLSEKFNTRSVQGPPAKSNGMRIVSSKPRPKLQQELSQNGKTVRILLKPSSTSVAFACRSSSFFRFFFYSFYVSIFVMACRFWVSFITIIVL